MRSLLLGAGASFSTKDVETGIYAALNELGHETIIYLLDKRLEVMSKWCKYMWKHLYKNDPARQPSWEDVCYRAGIEALEQALRFDVDWVLVVSGMYLHPDIMAMMRKAGLKIACIFTECPYEDEEQTKFHAKLAHVCFVNERCSVPTFKAANPNTFYLPHAFNQNSRTYTDGPVPSLCRRGSEIEEEVPAFDVVFIGTGFQERLDLLSSVDWTGINLGLFGTWNLLPRRHKLRKHIYGGVIANDDALSIYSRAKIGLNIYRVSKKYDVNSERIEHADSLNPRAYELSAMGTFSLTTPRQEGVELFGVTQPTFVGPEDLEKNIRYFLENEDQRKDLAAQAYERVQGHTYTERVSRIVRILNGS